MACRGRGLCGVGAAAGPPLWLAATNVPFRPGINVTWRHLRVWVARGQRGKAAAGSIVLSRPHASSQRPFAPLHLQGRLRRRERMLAVMIVTVDVYVQLDSIEMA